jgi:hypothetical protein
MNEVDRLKEINKRAFEMLENCANQIEKFGDAFSAVFIREFCEQNKENEND